MKESLAATFILSHPLTKIDLHSGKMMDEKWINLFFQIDIILYNRNGINNDAGLNHI